MSWTWPIPCHMLFLGFPRCQQTPMLLVFLIFRYASSLVFSRPQLCSLPNFFTLQEDSGPAEGPSDRWYLTSSSPYLIVYNKQVDEQVNVHRKHTFKNLMLLIVCLEGKKIKILLAAGGVYRGVKRHTDTVAHRPVFSWAHSCWCGDPL